MVKNDLLWVKRYIISRIADIYTPTNIINLDVTLYEIQGYTSYNFHVIAANEYIRDIVCNLLLKECSPNDKCINGMVSYDESHWRYAHFLQINTQEQVGGGMFWIDREEQLINSFNFYSNCWIASFYDSRNKNIHQKLNTILKDSLSYKPLTNKSGNEINLIAEDFEAKYNEEKRRLENKQWEEDIQRKETKIAATKIENNNERNLFLIVVLTIFLILAIALMLNYGFWGFIFFLIAIFIFGKLIMK